MKDVVAAVFSQVKQNDTDVYLCRLGFAHHELVVAIERTAAVCSLVLVERGEDSYSEERDNKRKHGGKRLAS